MFTITRSTFAGLVAVVCIAIVAPQAVARPVAHSAKSAQRVYGTRPASNTASPALKVGVNGMAAQPASSTALPTLKVGLNAIYVTGCLNGTIADRTMGGDNNNYDYYGDTCT